VKLRRAARLTRLTSPVPVHLLEIGFSQLGSVFQLVLDEVREQPLTFKQAGQLDYDDLRHNRRMEFQVIAWGSDGGVYDAYTPAPPSGSKRCDGEHPHLTPTVVRSDLKGRVSSGGVGEQDRFSLIDDGGIPTGHDPFIGEASNGGDPAPRDNYHPTDTEEGILPVAQQLLQLIEEAVLKNPKGVIKFCDVVVGTAPRDERACGFYTPLLSRVKRREVKVKQRAPVQIHSHQAS